ncbi:MAG: hypothetical protein HUJ75_02625 [Parasporobacterium sp.]|nr:hypothetical protein [Parasporobacterium sp.]
MPLTDQEIASYARKRNPMNHPTVMYKKSAVEAAGSYSEEFHLFEDYHLWVRMIMKGYKAANLPETLVYMRTPEDFYKRRGGAEYAQDMLRFHGWMKSEGFTNTMIYLTGAVPHAIVCRLPVSLRKAVYKVLH